VQAVTVDGNDTATASNLISTLIDHGYAVALKPPSCPLVSMDLLTSEVSFFQTHLLNIPVTLFTVTQRLLFQKKSLLFRVQKSMSTEWNS
jgi:hypothetical protein